MGSYFLKETLNHNKYFEIYSNALGKSTTPGLFKVQTLFIPTQL